MENNQKSIGVQTDYEMLKEEAGPAANGKAAKEQQEHYEMLKEEAGPAANRKAAKEQQERKVAFLRGKLEDKAPLAKVCSLRPHWRRFFFIMPYALILGLCPFCAFAYKILIPCLLWSGKSWHTMPLFLLTLSLTKYFFQCYFTLIWGWHECQQYLEVYLSESPIPEAHILILEWDRKEPSRHEDSIGLLLRRAVLEKAIARARDKFMGSQQSKLDRHQDIEAITMSLREALQINENPNEPDGLRPEEPLDKEMLGWLNGKMNTRAFLVLFFDTFWIVPGHLMAANWTWIVLSAMYDIGGDKADLVIVPLWVGLLYVFLVHFFLDVCIVYHLVSVRKMWGWATNEGA